jgi:hypothetical protein
MTTQYIIISSVLFDFQVIGNIGIVIDYNILFDFIHVLGV